MFRIFYFTTLILAASLLWTGCTDDCEQTYTRTVYEPVYMSYADMRSASAIETQAPAQLKDPGKLHLKDSYLYVNERGKGIHIINNSNPAAPQKVAFLKIPGNYEIAVRGNALYADSYVDLLVFDVSDMAHPTLTNRMENVLPYETFVNGATLDPSKGVVKEWVERQETVTVSCNNRWNGGMVEDDMVPLQNSTITTSGGTVSNGSGKGTTNDITNGVSGSMARFVLVDEYLYTASSNVLSAIDLSTLSKPVKRGETQVPILIETLFAYGSNLFIGASNGMYIYSISDKANPSYVSTYFHLTACDPVVVKDNYAYVTLRTGNTCSGWENLLQVVDLSNIYSPTMVASYTMSNPHGLAIQGSTLFLCDGAAGLKVFDATEINAIGNNLIRQYNDIQATDVIPFNGHYLMMIGSNGLYQFDFEDVNNIKQISVIPVEK